jgi:hypothetical protein
MKIEIQENGTIVISPESIKEDLLLRAWYREYATKPANEVIIFERFK